MAAAYTSTLLISDLKDRDATPYTKTLIVKVVTQGSWNEHLTVGGFKTQKLSAVLADSSGFKKCIVFGEKFESLFQPGRTLAIKNFAYKDGLIRIVNQSLVARHVPLDLPASLELAACSTLDMPVSPVKQIGLLSHSPLKSKVSFKGTIKTDEAPKIITTRSGSEINVRNLVVEDDTGEVEVALWREAVNINVSVGQHVLFKDCTIGTGRKRNQIVVSVNNFDELQLIDTTLQEVIEVHGGQEINEDLKLVDSNNVWHDAVPCNIIYAACHVDSFDDFMDALPITLCLTRMNGTVVACCVKSEKTLMQPVAQTAAKTTNQSDEPTEIALPEPAAAEETVTPGPSTEERDKLAAASPRPCSSKEHSD